MDNKTKCLYVAIAILLASNGYLLYRLGKTGPVVAEKKPVWVHGHFHRGGSRPITVRLEDVKSFWWSAGLEGYELNGVTALEIYVNDKKEIEKINKYIGKDYSSMPTEKK